MSTLITYPPPVEGAIARVERLLADQHVPLPTALSHRTLALLLLQRDPTVWAQVSSQAHVQATLESVIETAQAQLGQPLTLAIAQARQQQARRLEQAVLSEPEHTWRPLAERLHWLTVNPLTGFPILLLILYFGIYQFVGQFGAGTLVDWIETFFENRINPVVNQVVEWVIPWPVLQDLVAHDYGIITLGMRYAIAIVLPVVATYFLMFSLLEDSGYLPRLALMLDRVFKTMGLSGRAVIPMVLGLGCDTMATVVTRTLETRRERVIATFLLALAVPCAAQWGVILGLLAQNPLALMIWASVILGVFLVTGVLTARLLPGRKADFYMEVPPLRLPQLGNVMRKTFVRMKWYFWEIIPLFAWASVFIWLGRLTGLFDLLIRWLEPVVQALGLPVSVTPVFIYGFFRRDYGAAGLFDIQQTGGLTGEQLLVAAVILTLFLPCIAQLQVMLKERGWQITLAMVAFILPFAFAMGFLVHGLMSLTGAVI